MGGTAGAIAARMQGDDYQGRWFFIQALRMLDNDSHVTRVGLEQGSFPWFDDIITHYAASARSARRSADAHQIKFHVVADGALSFAALTDPGFIGSTRMSLLQRIIESYCARGGDANIVLMSPWGIKHDDLLGRMVQTGTNGSLRLHLLFDDKDKSAAAEIRRTLLAHANVNEHELRKALDCFRVEMTPSLPRLQNMLNDKLARHSFRTVGEEALANIYDDLGRKIIGQTVREFNKTSLRTLLHDEGLNEKQEPQFTPVRVGIRGFVRQAEYLDEFTTLLDLLDDFEQRNLRSNATWANVCSRVLAFMTQVDDAQHHDVEMHLSCHISIAYAAGCAVSTKSGTRYIVHQTGQRGSSDWDLSVRSDGSAEDLWGVHKVHLREDAPDVAVAVCLTHSIADDVKYYVERHVPAAGMLIILEPVGGASQTSVRDGAHAAAIAETFDHILATQRTPEQREAMLHLFAAAPNGFTFALGRAARRIAGTTLYEYDFEQKKPENYSPSIVLNTP